MNKLAEFLVNPWQAREKVCSGLIEAGYVVEVEQRTKRPYSHNSHNFYIIVYENLGKRDKE